MTASMSQQERAAIAAFAAKLSSAYAELAIAFGGDALTATGSAPIGPSTVNLSWNERVLRQSLILHEIEERGGHVPQTIFYEIAQRYGYSGRGLAGFFRTNGQGLLELRTNNKRVYITRRGRDRLKQNKERVDAWLTAQASPTPEAPAV